MDGLRAWAESIMTGWPPDFVIGEPDNPYMRRWHVVPRNPFSNVYLHEILRSDDDRALHDHPWDNRTIVLEGRYFEHLQGGMCFERAAGWVGARLAETAHRLEVRPGERAVTLFFTDAVRRDWGFLCPQGWRHWREFTAPADKGRIGRGCD